MKTSNDKLQDLCDEISVRLNLEEEIECNQSQDRFKTRLLVYAGQESGHSRQTIPPPVCCFPLFPPCCPLVAAAAALLLPVLIGACCSIDQDQATNTTVHRLCHSFTHALFCFIFFCSVISLLSCTSSLGKTTTVFAFLAHNRKARPRTIS